MTPDSPDSARRIGLREALLIGVGATVGGGVFALAGSAFALTGPSAILAFVLNGFVALLTALSFAEMATAFPESGGTYVFARRVLSVQAAFVVGWVLWFAYIAAGLLYALGFGAFADAALRALLPADSTVLHPRLPTLLALAAVAGYTALFMRKAGGGGAIETVGKIVVYAVLIIAGLGMLPFRAVAGELGTLTPAFTGGLGGFAAAMGLTFISLQGFDAIAAVAGEVRQPARVLPRAMAASIGIALLIYVPLLFVVATTGVPVGEHIAAVAASDPETLVARAARRILGPVGWWLVIAAALLGMLSALAANVVAASRVAASMAADRTLPSILGTRDPRTGAPRLAVFASGLTMAVLLGLVPDVPAAAAAAGLIFLLSFLLAHVTALLARLRGGGGRPDAFRTPFFPLVPLLGIATCAVLAGYQLGTQPQGTAVTAAWIGLGALLYAAVFHERASSVDARAEAVDPELARLRGRSPLVLAPLSNPAHAASLVALARAIAPPEVGRVLLLSVLKGDSDDPEGLVPEVERAQLLVRRALESALTRSGRGERAPETLLTVAADPWAEIRRVARVHHCRSVVLGLTHLAEGERAGSLELLLAELDADIVVLQAPPGWELPSARRVLVPIGGRGRHDELRARLLGAIARWGPREVTFVRVLPTSASDAQVEVARQDLRRFAADEAHSTDVLVLRSDDPAGELVRRAEEHDLIVLGLSRADSGRRTLEGTASQVAGSTRCATVILGRGRR